MAYQIYRTTGALAAKKAQEEAAAKQVQAIAQQERASAVQEGSDIGGILGLIGAGVGAAAIALTGGLAAPVAIPMIAASAGLGSTVGSALGKTAANQFAPEVAPAAPQGKSQAQQELDIMGAMKSRTQSMMPTLSETTQRMAKSVQALGQAPESLQQEYGDVMLKGLTQSYMKDILNSRRKI